MGVFDPCANYVSIRVNIIRDIYFLCIAALIFFPFLCWVKFCSGCFRQVLFIWETKKVVAGCIRHVVGCLIQ